MKREQTKMIKFKVTERESESIKDLTRRLHLVNVNECIRQVLLSRAADQAAKTEGASIADLKAQIRKLQDMNERLKRAGNEGCRQSLGSLAL